MPPLLGCPLALRTRQYVWSPPRKCRMAGRPRLRISRAPATSRFPPHWDFPEITPSLTRTAWRPSVQEPRPTRPVVTGWAIIAPRRRNLGFRLRDPNSAIAREGSKFSPGGIQIRHLLIGRSAKCYGYSSATWRNGRLGDMADLAECEICEVQWSTWRH